MVKESSIGKMVRNIMENSRIINSMESALTNGKMEGSMKVSGQAMKCMAKEDLDGMMAEPMKANIIKVKIMILFFIQIIRKKVKESIPGQMEGSMKETGIMINNTAKASLLILKGRLGKEYGRKEKELNGEIKYVAERKIFHKTIFN